MSFVPRRFFHAPLEPETQVLHGAGQSPEAFQAYVALHEEQGTLPLVYMSYCGAKSPVEYQLKWLARLQEQLATFPDLPLMPQIGLSMTRDGSPEEHYEHDVANGKYDEQLKTLFDGLNLLGHPFFLRIGYECNGPWNGYEPRAYQDAFAHVTGLLRAAGSPAATVWCVDCLDIDKAMAWCPPDDVADWWSVDWFDPDHMAQSAGFLLQADAQRKPVMIGESTPRRVGVMEGQASWDRWYKPYFDTIRMSPVIKAFCYINWNWGGYPMWHDWGDGRLESNETIRGNWLQEMRCPLYAHARKSVE